MGTGGTTTGGWIVITLLLLLIPPLLLLVVLPLPLPLVCRRSGMLVLLTFVAEEGDEVDPGAGGG
jgi:hypothetical protein